MLTSCNQTLPVFEDLVLLYIVARILGTLLLFHAPLVARRQSREIPSPTYSTTSETRFGKAFFRCVMSQVIPGRGILNPGNVVRQFSVIITSSSGNRKTGVLEPADNPTNIDI